MRKPDNAGLLIQRGKQLGFRRGRQIANVLERQAHAVMLAEGRLQTPGR